MPGKLWCSDDGHQPLLLQFHQISNANLPSSSVLRSQTTGGYFGLQIVCVGGVLFGTTKRLSLAPEGHVAEVQARMCFEIPEGGALTSSLSTDGQASGRKRPSRPSALLFLRLETEMKEVYRAMGGGAGAGSNGLIV